MTLEVVKPCWYHKGNHWLQCNSAAFLTSSMIHECLGWPGGYVRKKSEHQLSLGRLKSVVHSSSPARVDWLLVIKRATAASAPASDLCCGGNDKHRNPSAGSELGFTGSRLHWCIQRWLAHSLPRTLLCAPLPHLLGLRPRSWRVQQNPIAIGSDRPCSVPFVAVFVDEGSAEESFRSDWTGLSP